MQQKPKAVLLDLDGTLVKTWTTDPLPGVYGILRRLEQDRPEQEKRGDTDA